MSDAIDSRNLNALLVESTELIALVGSDALSGDLHSLQVDWRRQRVNPGSSVGALFVASGFTETDDPSKLTRAGLLFLSRVLIHYDKSVLGSDGELARRYVNFELMSAGKNSIVFSAEHRALGTRFVLKLVRPGASENVIEAVRRLSRISDPETALVLPIDVFTTSLKDVFGTELEAICLVFRLVRGQTLRRFLAQENSFLNSQIALAFAFQVGGAMAELERVGAYHGDLHEENVIVDDSSSSGLVFRVVDVSFDAMGSLPREECRNTDLTNFKQHIWRILSAQRVGIPNLSIRKFLGTRAFLQVSDILSSDTDSFDRVCRILTSGASYSQFVIEKERFLSDNFAAPASFRLQRYEEITDQTVAVKLFVPFPELMTRIKGFGNAYVSGNRGSGKSTYLASLAFFPGANGSLLDSDDLFGVYFPCRQGEFRVLAARPQWSFGENEAVTATVLVTKIVRTTLESVMRGVAANKLTLPSEVNDLKAFVSAFVPEPGLVSVERDVRSELENLVSTMVRVEMAQMGAMPSPTPPMVPHISGRTLLNFFGLLRAYFPELSSARFHLLFDDAGVPYVPINVQAALCDLMLLSNSLFCVKVTAEKFTFDFSSSEGKALEIGQDYFEHDISHVLFIGTDRTGLRRSVLEGHFRTIVQQRLEYFGYRSADIVDYLGDGQIPPEVLITRLSEGRRNAYYSGWTTVWNIADRTPRNLLEIVSEIFAAGGIGKDSEPAVVSSQDQSRAIRLISEKRLDSLSQIAGTVFIGGKTVSLGRHLFEVTTSLGSTFRKYLRGQVDRETRRQSLAIERNDLGELSADAEAVLRRLVTFGVLDATKLEYSRDDEARKHIYVLNRIYCPIFGIAYWRDDHLRLSRLKLETLLLNPALFLRDGTRRLRDMSDGDELDLFSLRLKL